MVKQSAELWAVCGNIVRRQRVSWFPLCAARHLHNLCYSYQEFDTVLNFDICTMLIDGCWGFFFFFGLACAHLCWWCRKTVRFEVHKHTRCRHARWPVWPCVRRFGLWLFGGQWWCGIRLLEWIHHLQPYKDLHQLSWGFHSQREKFMLSFYSFTGNSLEMFPLLESNLRFFYNWMSLGWGIF